MLKHKKDITIHNIFTSPSHNYFTRDKFDIGNAPSIEHKSIELKRERGLKDDRFEFSKYPVTFFSLEVAEDVCSSLELELDLKLFRRNIIVSGINLNSLIGQRFKIGDIEFEGITHCAPCTWMNAVMKKGAYAKMRGRGGLRAKVIRGGLLTCESATLESETSLNENPLKALDKPTLPKI